MGETYHRLLTELYQWFFPAGVTVAAVVALILPVGQVLGMWTVGRKWWWAWNTVFFVQLVGFAFAHTNHHPSFYIQAIGCGAMSAANAWKWWRQHTSASLDPLVTMMPLPRYPSLAARLHIELHGHVADTTRVSAAQTAVHDWLTELADDRGRGWLPRFGYRLAARAIHADLIAEREAA